MNTDFFNGQPLPPNTSVVPGPPNLPRGTVTFLYPGGSASILRNGQVVPPGHTVWNGYIVPFGYAVWGNLAVPIDRYHALKTAHEKELQDIEKRNAHCRAASEALLKWFRDQEGFVRPGVIIKFDNYVEGFKVWAEHEVGAGTIIKCPRKLSLSIMDIEKSDSMAKRLLSHRDKHITIQTISYFFLAEQRLLGKESFWAPYISALPDTDAMTMPLWFMSNEMEWLEGTNLYPSVDERIKQWLADWKRATEVLTKQGVDASKVTFLLFAWAGTIFTSRSFVSGSTLRGEFKELFPILWPVVDLLNHRPMEEVEWITWDDAFTLHIRKEAKANTEICNNYAPKSNEELLMGYGFCVRNNPFDEYAVKHKHHSSAFYLRDWTYKGTRYDQPQYLRAIPPMLLDLMTKDRSTTATTFAEAPEKMKMILIGDLIKQLTGRRDTLVQKTRILQDQKVDSIRWTHIDQVMRYRRSQEQILDHICRELIMYMNEYRLLDKPKNRLLELPAGTYIITIDTAVDCSCSDAEATFTRNFIAGMEAGYGHFSSDMLEFQGHIDTVWALFLCALLVQFSTRLPDGNTLYTRWLHNLLTQFPVRDLDPSENQDPGFRVFREDFMETVLLARKANVAPALWNDSRWEEFQVAAWAKRVVSSEVNALPRDPSQAEVDIEMDGQIISNRDNDTCMFMALEAIETGAEAESGAGSLFGGDRKCARVS